FQAGLITLASAAGSLLMRFTFRPLLRLFGFRHLLIFNALLTGAFLIGCGFFTPATPYLVIIAALFIGGLSRSVPVPPPPSPPSAAPPPAQTRPPTRFSA